jgi:hypothetical protein
MNKNRQCVLGVLMAGSLCIAFAVFALPTENLQKGVNENGSARKARKESAKEPLVTTRISKGSGVALKAGYRFVRKGRNEGAIYKANGPGGITLRCVCPSSTAEICELKRDPESDALYVCDAHGCQECQMQVIQPKGTAASFREVKRITPVERSAKPK